MHISQRYVSRIKTLLVVTALVVGSNSGAQTEGSGSTCSGTGSYEYDINCSKSNSGCWHIKVDSWSHCGSSTNPNDTCQMTGTQATATVSYWTGTCVEKTTNGATTVVCWNPNPQWATEVIGVPTCVAATKSSSPDSQ